MGVSQEEFVKTFVLAVSEENVIKKIEASICGQLTMYVAELRDVRKRGNRISKFMQEFERLKVAVDE